MEAESRSPSQSPGDQASSVVKERRAIYVFLTSGARPPLQDICETPTLCQPLGWGWSWGKSWDHLSPTESLVKRTGDAGRGRMVCNSSGMESQQSISGWGTGPWDEGCSGRGATLWEQRRVQMPAKCSPEGAFHHTPTATTLGSCFSEEEAEVLSIKEHLRSWRQGPSS